MKTWRDNARRIIAKAIIDGRTAGLSGVELRKFVSARYPYGERAMHPYKVWLSELNRQLGASAKKRPADQAKIDAWNKTVGQGTLFNEEKPT